MFHLATGMSVEATAYIFGIEATMFTLRQREVVHAVIEALYDHTDACLRLPHDTEGWNALARTFQPLLFSRTSSSLAHAVAAVGTTRIPIKLRVSSTANDANRGGSRAAGDDCRTGVSTTPGATPFSETERPMLQSAALLFDGNRRILDAGLMHSGARRDGALLENMTSLDRVPAPFHVLIDSGEKKGGQYREKYRESDAECRQ